MVHLLSEAGKSGGWVASSDVLSAGVVVSDVMGVPKLRRFPWGSVKAEAHPRVGGFFLSDEDFRDFAVPERKDAVELNGDEGERDLPEGV
jgi:hypothetical protein